MDEQFIWVAETDKEGMEYQGKLYEPLADANESEFVDRNCYELGAKFAMIIRGKILVILNDKTTKILYETQDY